MWEKGLVAPEGFDTAFGNEPSAVLGLRVGPFDASGRVHWGHFGPHLQPA